MAQNKTTATTTNKTGRPNNAGLTWCLAGRAVAAVEVASGKAGAGVVRLTVDRAVPCRATPFWLLVRSEVAVPGCRPLDGVPVAAGWPAVWGLWVVVCAPEPVVAVSGLSAIGTIVPGA